MIPVPRGVRVWQATGHTDMRKGVPGLALVVQETLKRDPHDGHLFVFRYRRGDLIKVLWHDGQGACLFSKKLERGRFICPLPADGAITIMSAQLGYLLEGIDWRMPQRTMCSPRSVFTATTPRCPSWRRARLTPAAPGSMSATIAPLVGHHHR